MRYKYTHDMSGRKLPPYMSLNIMLWRQIFFFRMDKEGSQI